MHNVLQSNKIMVVPLNNGHRIFIIIKTFSAFQNVLMQIHSIFVQNKNDDQGDSILLFLKNGKLSYTTDLH